MSRHSDIPTARTQFFNTVSKAEYLQNIRWELIDKAVKLGVPRPAAAQQVHAEIRDLLEHADRLTREF